MTHEFTNTVRTVDLEPALFAQRDEVDGEIDLKSCVKVSEFDVEKNYGFQIQVSRGGVCHPVRTCCIPPHLISLSLSSCRRETPCSRSRP